MRRAPVKRYVVREIPWLAGSKRRVVDRFCYFTKARRLARDLSGENRQVVVECNHLTLETWINGHLV